MGQIEHANRAHALLSASSSKRWLTCTPSARLEELFPDKEASIYAAEGTRAHEIAEMCLRAYLDGKKEPEFTGKDLEIRKELSPYIDDVLETYLAEKKENPDTLLFLETRVDFSEYVPDGFGTADVIILSGSRMHVRDLKFGKGVVVEANENPQARLYGLGALHEFGEFYEIETILNEIHQPRLDAFTAEEISVEELIKWGKDYVMPRAKQAINGEGTYVAGAHCQFCKAKSRCRALAELFLDEEPILGSDPALLQDEDLSHILDISKMFGNWLDSIKEYATNLLLEGGSLAGWKLVEGRSVRKYSDEKAVSDKLLSAGYKEAEIYERSLYGITAMEKNIGKKKFNELLSDLIIKPAGAPTLAPESDKRKEYDRQQSLINAMEIKED